MLHASAALLEVLLELLEEEEPQIILWCTLFRVGTRVPVIEVFFEVVQRREKKCAREARAGVHIFFFTKDDKKNL